MSQVGVLSNSGVTPVGPGRFPITPFVVGTSGQAGYQTIQSAINAAHASGGGVVYIQPGTYTENLTLFDQVDLYGTPAVSQNQGTGSSVTITGTHTPPNSGHIGFNSICFISTTDVMFSNAVGSTHIVLLNCESAVQNGYFFNLPNWTGTLEVGDHNPVTSGAPFSINDGGINNVTGSSSFVCFNAGFGSGTNHMFLNGVVFFESGEIGSPITFGSGAQLLTQWVTFSDTVTFSGNATGFIYYSSFLSGTHQAIIMNSSSPIDISECIINSTFNPAIGGTGAGALTLGGNTFTNNANNSGTLILAPAAATVSGEIRAGADSGGETGFTSLTKTNSSTISTGVGSVKMSTGNAATNTAWIKIYIGTNAFWIPAWTTNAP